MCFTDGGAIQNPYQKTVLVYPKPRAPSNEVPTGKDLRLRMPKGGRRGGSLIVLIPIRCNYNRVTLNHSIIKR
jgi:hypothetical protein